MPKDETEPTSTAISSLAKYLRPDKFDIEPDAADADSQWLYWKTTFESFLSEEAKPNEIPGTLKLKLLINHLSASIYKHVKACKTYGAAIKTLDGMYVKTKNTILARHILFNRKQHTDETVADYVRALRLAAIDCSFEAVTAMEHEEQAIRAALISGLTSCKIKERLLEGDILTLDETVGKAIIHGYSFNSVTIM